MKYFIYIFISWCLVSCSSSAIEKDTTTTTNHSGTTTNIPERVDLSTFSGYWVLEGLIDRIQKRKEYYTIEVPHKAFLIFSQIRVQQDEEQISPQIGTFNNAAWGYEQVWINDTTLKVETADRTLHLVFSFSTSTQKIQGEVFKNNTSLATCSYSREYRKTGDKSMFSIDDIIGQYCLMGDYINLVTGEEIIISANSINETVHYQATVEYYYLDKLSTPLNLMTLDALYPKEEYGDDRDFRANACWEWHQDTLMIYKLYRVDEEMGTVPQKGEQIMALLADQDDFKSYFYSLPMFNSLTSYTCNDDLPISELPKSRHTPEGASLLGTLPPVNGYYPILYTYPADIVLPILVFHNKKTLKKKEIQLFDMSFCNADYPEQYSSFQILDKHLIEIKNYRLDESDKETITALDTIDLTKWLVNCNTDTIPTQQLIPTYNEARQTVQIAETSINHTTKYLNYRSKVLYFRHSPLSIFNLEIEEEKGQFVPIDNMDFFNSHQNQLLEQLNQTFNAQYFAVEDRDCVNSPFYSWTSMNDLGVLFDKEGVHFYNDFGFPEMCKYLDRPTISMTWQEIAPYLGDH